jgi:hypothetical protein
MQWGSVVENRATDYNFQDREQNRFQMISDGSFIILKNVCLTDVAVISLPNGFGKNEVVC